jgi:iron complex outermembrane receptor protein
MFAFGLSQYREKFQSKPSLFAQAALADPVAGTPAPGGPGTGDQRFGDSSASIPYSANRKVFGAFVEASMQPAEWMELTGSVRRDDYDDVGESTNYKASFRLTPTDTLLFRGSYGTGFHVPTVPQLNATIQNYGVTSTPYDCSPALQAIATSLGAICRPPQSQYDVFAAGNPDLQPEESRQGSLGAVWEVAPRISLGADWWWVGIEDAFGQIEETAAFGDPGRYPDSWTTFTDIGTGETYLALDQSNVNTGKEYYSGVDFNIQARWDTGFGRIRSTLVATHMLKNALQLAEGGPYFENISDYSADLDTVTFRWGGKLTTSLEHGPWSHTLAANFRTGYKDTLVTVDGIDAPGVFNGEVLDVRLDVDDYYTFDWQSEWRVTDAIGITVGALNVLDEDPPRSLQSTNFQIGYDPRFYDPRGRVLFGRVGFTF